MGAELLETSVETFGDLWKSSARRLAREPYVRLGGVYVCNYEAWPPCAVVKPMCLMCGYEAYVPYDPPAPVLCDTSEAAEIAAHDMCPCNAAFLLPSGTAYHATPCLSSVLICAGPCACGCPLPGRILFRATPGDIIPQATKFQAYPENCWLHGAL